jgi:branched-chain amino acid aminotransferase
VESGFVYFEGKVVPMAEARVSVATHALHYGTGCFEGIRAYWNPKEEALYLLHGMPHFLRFLTSCKIIKIAMPHSARQLTDIALDLLRRNSYRQDVYIRPLAYKASPVVKLALSGLEDQLAVLTFPMGDYIDIEKGLHLTISAWQRNSDNALPARAKVSGGYINAALAYDDAKASGFDDAVMLTRDGHVSEASAANLFMVMGGTLVTSPVTEDILVGITRASIMELANDMGTPVLERPIDRTELWAADEVFLCGTGVQVSPVTQIDHRPVGSGRPGPMTLEVQAAYLGAVRGEEPRYQHWLERV